MNQNIDRSKIPGPREHRPFHFPEYESFTISNGLKVIHAPYGDLPLVSINLCIRTGALIETEGREGLANFTSELISEGTKSRSSVNIANELEFLGAHLDIFSDWNATYVELNTLKKHLSSAMDVYEDILFNPIFPEREFERIKKELLTGRLQGMDNPSKIANERFADFLYGDFRYARPLEGNEISIQNITLDEIKNFYIKQYIPNNAVLVVVGDISRAEAEELVNKYFADWQTGISVDFKVPAFKNPDKTSIKLIHKEGAVQTEFRIGHHGIERNHPDFYSVMLMNEILGGYFLSRINMNLREEHGYTYGASSKFNFRQGTGPFQISTAADIRYTLETITEIFNEIKELQLSEVTDDEIQSSKGHITGIFPVAFETADQIALGLANIVVFDLPHDYFRTFRDKINNVTKEDILRAANKFIHPEQMFIIATTDRVKTEERLRESFTVEVYDIMGKRIDS
ncbi:MAG: M16 family metallopeptidase [Calditrichaceae bacterium]